MPPFLEPVDAEEPWRARPGIGIDGVRACIVGLDVGSYAGGEAESSAVNVA